MKRVKIIILGLVVLMLGVQLFATDIPSGSSNYEVLFPGYKLNAYGAISCVALKFYSADVSIEFFYDGVQVDSVLQKAGSGVTYTTPCDSINIIRSVATGGVYLLGTADGKVCPQIESDVLSDSLYGEMDTLQALFESPEPRSPILRLIAEDIKTTTINKTYPDNGFPLLGLREVHVLLNWENFDQGDFAVEVILAPNGTVDQDSNYVFMSAADDDGMMYNFNYRIKPENGGAVLQLRDIPDVLGDLYLYVRVTEDTTLAADFTLDATAGGTE